MNASTQYTLNPPTAWPFTIIYIYYYLAQIEDLSIGPALPLPDPHLMMLSASSTLLVDTCTNVEKTEANKPTDVCCDTKAIQKTR